MSFQEKIYAVTLNRKTGIVRACYLQHTDSQFFVVQYTCVLPTLGINNLYIMYGICVIPASRCVPHTTKDETRYNSSTRSKRISLYISCLRMQCSTNTFPGKTTFIISKPTTYACNRDIKAAIAHLHVLLLRCVILLQYVTPVEHTYIILLDTYYTLRKK